MTLSTAQPTAAWVSSRIEIAMMCAVIVALGAGCQRSPSAAVDNVDNRKGTTTTRTSAQTYERGDGVPRDYARAFEIHIADCKDGRGDLAACDAALDASVSARGTARDGRRELRLLQAMCTRGDGVGCFQSMYLEAMGDRFRRNTFGVPDDPETDERFKAKFDAALHRVERACARGEGRACAVMFGLVGGDGGTAEERRRDHADVACQQGSVELCNWLIVELWGCDDGDDLQACERVVGEWRSRPWNERQLAALDRLQTWCDAGEARACDELPGRPIPDEQLCAAHDYRACDSLACMGDDAAGELAARHGADANCNVAHGRALKRWRAQGADEPPPIAADPMEPIGSRPTKPFEAVMFRVHGGRDRRGWPRYDVHNISDQPVVELVVCAYAHDEEGNLLARVREGVPIVPIPPNGSVLLELGRDDTIPKLRREAVAGSISYDRIRFANTTAVEDLGRCPPLGAPTYP